MTINMRSKRRLRNGARYKKSTYTARTGNSFGGEKSRKTVKVSGSTKAAAHGLHMPVDTAGHR